MADVEWRRCESGCTGRNELFGVGCAWRGACRVYACALGRRRCAANAVQKAAAIAVVQSDAATAPKGVPAGKATVTKQQRSYQKACCGMPLCDSHRTLYAACVEITDVSPDLLLLPQVLKKKLCERQLHTTNGEIDKLVKRRKRETSALEVLAGG